MNPLREDMQPFPIHTPVGFAISQNLNITNDSLELGGIFIVADS